MSTHADYAARAKEDAASGETDAPSGRSFAEDIADGFSRADLAWHLANLDLRNRNRHSRIGRGWFAITQAIGVAGIGTVYGKVFGLPLDVFIPYLASGLVAWALIAGFIGEATGTFVASAPYLTQMRLPLSLFALRAVFRNAVQFSFRATVVVAAFALFGHVPGPEALLALPGVLLVLASGAGLALVGGMLGARFRDLGPFVTAILPFLFLITPIIWMADRLGDARWIVVYNPLYHYVKVVRGPLLGHDDLVTSFAVVSASTVLLLAGGAAVLRAVGRRIVFWL